MIILEVKISGKISHGGKNWTFSAASYAHAEGDWTFIVETVAKSGKMTMPVSLCVSEASSAASLLVNGVADGAVVQSGNCDWTEYSVRMWRNMWKDKATAAAAKAELAKWEGVYALSLDGSDGYGSGYLSLTVGKDGNVKASGKLADGTSVSATSPLMYDDDAGWFAMLYAAPSAYKGGCFAAAVGFGFDGGGAVATSGFRLAPVMFTPQWTSLNPQATGDYGKGFCRYPEFTGAYYNKMNVLYDYYEALMFSADSPTLSGASPLNDAEDIDVTVGWNGKFGIDKASGLSLSFANATGIFKGGYTFVFNAKTKKKISFEGIFVPGSEALRGFYLWDASNIYKDSKTGKWKSYKYKESHSVRLEEGCGSCHL